MGKLTDLKIRSWIRAKKPLARADGGGLTFTFSAHGTAAWVLRFRFSGKSRELTIGRYPDISLAKARELASDARAKIQQGIDVAREKQKSKIAQAEAMSLRQLAADYSEKTFPNFAANTVKQRRHHIDDIIVPRLGGIAARDVTTADVVSLIESVGQRSQNVAELVYTATSEMFKHGVARHVVTTNPCTGISVAAICGKPVPKRQRLNLTADELRVILPALPTIGDQNALAVKIQLATCTRIGELARARWEHVNLEKAEWVVPDHNSKTKKTFTIPLSPLAVRWFSELQVLCCGSPFVLPARQSRRRSNEGGETHYEQRALNSMLHKLCDRLEHDYAEGLVKTTVRRFTPHDLRSTARSHLSELGVSVIVAERCLNHSLGGLIATYDKHDYMSERRAALVLWADFIQACETEREWTPKAENIVPFRHGAP